MGDQANNVVPFTGVWKGKHPRPAKKSAKEIRKLTDELKQEDAVDITNEITDLIIHGLEQANFHVLNNDQVMAEVCFVGEAVHALALKYMGADHSLHRVAQVCFDTSKDNLEFDPPKFRFVRSKQPVVEAPPEDTPPNDAA